MERAYEIATGEGLHYVTLGNVPGHENNSTFCPNCKKKIIYRIHFTSVKLTWSTENVSSAGIPLPAIGIDGSALGKNKYEQAAEINK